MVGPNSAQPEMMFDQFVCTSQLCPLQLWLTAAPLAASVVVPYLNAHLSAFLLPRRSNQALPSVTNLERAETLRRRLGLDSNELPLSF
jgi:hypothetical protein